MIHRKNRGDDTFLDKRILERPQNPLIARVVSLSICNFHPPPSSIEDSLVNEYSSSRSMIRVCIIVPKVNAEYVDRTSISTFYFLFAPLSLSLSRFNESINSPTRVETRMYRKSTRIRPRKLFLESPLTIMWKSTRFAIRIHWNLPFYRGNSTSRLSRLART